MRCVEQVEMETVSGSGRRNIERQVGPTSREIAWWWRAVAAVKSASFDFEVILGPKIQPEGRGGVRSRAWGGDTPWAKFREGN